MVESTALEMRRAFTGTVGSNPTLSATSRKRLLIQSLFLALGRVVSQVVSRHQHDPRQAKMVRVRPLGAKRQQPHLLQRFAQSASAGER